jgi:hypothetical protein
MTSRYPWNNDKIPMDISWPHYYIIRLQEAARGGVIGLENILLGLLEVCEVVGVGAVVTQSAKAARAS